MKITVNKRLVKFGFTTKPKDLPTGQNVITLWLSSRMIPFVRRHYYKIYTLVWGGTEGLRLIHN
jgi:hypothetical protein